MLTKYLDQAVVSKIFLRFFRVEVPAFEMIGEGGPFWSEDFPAGY